MSKKRADLKAAQKECPSCNDSIPVACKSCTCGHQFSSRKHRTKSEVEKLHAENTVTPPTDINIETVVSEDVSTKSLVKPRRTERRKADRPDFFNSLKVDHATKRYSRVSESPTKKKRGRPKGSGDKTPKEEKKSTSSTSSIQSPEDESLFANMPAEKIFQMSIVLSELNRKIGGQTFRPL